MSNYTCRSMRTRTKLRATLLIAAIGWGMIISVPLRADTIKDRNRCTYVMKQMKMTQAGRVKFAPVFMAYLKELKVAKSDYTGLKNQLKKSIKANSLTETQAKELLEAHWASDEKEVEVKRRYTDKFIRMVGTKATFNIFRFANDKESTK